MIVGLFSEQVAVNVFCQVVHQLYYMFIFNLAKLTESWMTSPECSNSTGSQLQAGLHKLATIVLPVVTQVNDIWNERNVLYDINHILNCGYEIKWSYGPCISLIHSSVDLSVKPASRGHGFKPRCSPKLFNLSLRNFETFSMEQSFRVGGSPAP